MTQKSHKSSARWWGWLPDLRQLIVANASSHIYISNGVCIVCDLSQFFSDWIIVVNQTLAHFSLAQFHPPHISIWIPYMYTRGMLTHFVNWKTKITVVWQKYITSKLRSPIVIAVWRAGYSVWACVCWTKRYWSDYIGIGSTVMCWTVHTQTSVNPCNSIYSSNRPKAMLCSRYTHTHARFGDECWCYA